MKTVRNEMSYLFFAVFFFFIVPLHSQDNIDSLQSLPDDTNKVKGLLNAASNYARQDPKLAIKLTEQGRQLAVKLAFRQGEGAAYQRTGIVHYYQGDLAAALDQLLKALKIFRDIDHKKGIGTTENLVGVIYHAKENTARALEHYRTALEMYRLLGDKFGMASGYNNIGLVCLLKKDYTGALDNFKQALPLLRETGQVTSEAIALNNMGNVYTGLANYSKALTYYSEALALKQKLNDNYGLVETYHSLGRMYYKMHEFSKASDNLQQAIVYAKNIGELSHLSESYDFLARCDSARKDYLSAYLHMRDFSQTRDSLLSAENLKQMAEIQTRYETEKKELLIENQEKEIAKQAFQKIAFAIGFITMIVLSLFVFRSYRLKKKANLAIMMQKKVIEEKNREILDSIYYARRIQRSLMPTEKYISRVLQATRQAKDGRNT